MQVFNTGLFADTTLSVCLSWDEVKILRLGLNDTKTILEQSSVNKDAVQALIALGEEILDVW